MSRSIESLELTLTNNGNIDSKITMKGYTQKHKTKTKQFCLYSYSETLRHINLQTEWYASSRPRLYSKLWSNTSMLITYIATASLILAITEAITDLPLAYCISFIRPYGLCMYISFKTVYVNYNLLHYYKA